MVKSSFVSKSRTNEKKKIQVIPKDQTLYFKNYTSINYIWQLLRVFHLITSD